MPILTKCIYGYETDPKKTPFGLLNNQVRGDNIIQNAGWFNLDGNVLGRGDLSLKDMRNIATRIPADEAFFVLSEAASTWDLPSHLDRTAPGFAYIIQKALWVMMQTPTGGCIVRIRDDIEKSEEIKNEDGKYLRIPRKDIYTAFRYDAGGNPIPRAPEKTSELKTTSPPLIKAKVLCKSCGQLTSKCFCKIGVGSTKAPIKTAKKRPILTTGPATPSAPVKKTNPPIGSGPSLTLPPRRMKIRINPVP
jgi:hypothetical protein